VKGVRDEILYHLNLYVATTKTLYALTGS